TAVVIHCGNVFTFNYRRIVVLPKPNSKKNNQKLTLFNKELREANQIKARFFSILNHDLRSPVSNIIKLIRLQQNTHVELDDVTKKRLQTQTVASAENLLSSMEDLLLWSKGQMENFKPQFKKTEI